MSPPLKKYVTSLTILEIKEDRRKGFSLSEIVSKYGISFRKAKEYTKDTDIAAEYLSSWISKRGGSKKSAILRRHYIYEIIHHQYSEDLPFKHRDKLLILISLYWAEGSKRNMSFLNSDSRMVKLYVYLLKDVLNITSNQLTISIRIFEDMDPVLCKKYWSTLLSIPVSYVYILKGKKLGKLPYGMCTVVVKSGSAILTNILAHIDCFSEKLAPIAQTDRVEDS